MKPEVTIFFRAHLPRDLLKSFIQHVRDFDVAHPGCHFEIMADDCGLNLQQMIEALRINPKLSFMEIIKLDKEREK
jgi:hypothetical protein